MSDGIYVDPNSPMGLAARVAALEGQAQAQADVIGALCALFDVDPLAAEPGPAEVIAEALRGSQARLAAKRKQGASQ